MRKVEATVAYVLQAPSSALEVVWLVEVVPADHVLTAWEARRNGVLVRAIRGRPFRPSRNLVVVLPGARLVAVLVRNLLEFRPFVAVVRSTPLSLQWKVSQVGPGGAPVGRPGAVFAPFDTSFGVAPLATSPRRIPSAPIPARKPASRIVEA